MPKNIRGLLPDGLVWIGFDENLISVAASIEARRPGTGKDALFEGCVAVSKCRVAPGEPNFGRHITEFQIVALVKDKTE